MNTRVLTVLNSVLLATAVSLSFPSQGLATPQSDKPAAEAKTEDVLHMSDGRVLRGQIISETRSDIVFEYRDPKLNLNAKMTLSKENIALIERDQPIEGAAEEKPAESAPSGKPGSSAPRSSSTNKPAAAATPNYGISRVTGDAANVPSLYVVPFKGQMGTDIRSSEYKKLVDDIRQAKPDVVVIQVHSGDTSDLMHPEGYDTPPVGSKAELEKYRQREWGMLEFEDYRELVHAFRNDLRDIRQVAWVHDSDGVSATIIMAWPDIYMTPTARLGAKVSVMEKSNAKKWADPDVRAKMIAAWSGMAKGFLEKGGYSLALAEAMLDETPVLSGKWRGREVIWTLDDTGDYVVDSSDRHSAYFTAKTAEDFCISDGTAETLDDLALLLGFREYRLIEGKQGEIDQYREGWRKAYDDTQVWIRDHEQHMGWASGADQLKWLGKAKSDIEKILSAMDRYPAVEVRWENDYGIPKIYFITLVERLKEQIIALKKQQQATGGNRGGGGGGGGRLSGGGG